MGEKQENDLVCRSDRDLADLSVTELQERLETSATGLSKKEAERRVDQYGYNELGEEKAYPVLKKYNLPATIFVVTDFVGREDFLSWDDINAMSPDIITIGSHTMSHSWLPDLDGNGLRKELAGSKDMIEKMTGRKVNLLSYPLGGFNESAKKIAEETGYIGAVTTNPGKDSKGTDPYALKRIRISDSADNSFVLWAETSGYYTFIKERRDDD